MKTSCILVAALAVAALTGNASAGSDYLVTFAPSAADADECTLTSTASAGGDTLVVVHVDSGGAQVGASEAFEVSVGATTQTLAKDAHQVAFAAGTYAGATVEVRRAADQSKRCLVKLGDASVLDDAAREFLLKAGIVGHRVSGDAFGRVHVLFHLPDGRPAFPLPRHIAEEDEIEIWIVRPKADGTSTTATLDVIACDEVPSFRVQGSYKNAAANAGALQGRDVAVTAFVLEQAGPRLQCAGKLTYKLEVTGGPAEGSTTTSISIHAVYKFSWGVGYMFDFGRPRSLELGDRPDAAGAGTEKFIIETDDQIGARPVVTLAFHPCGVNPTRLDWCDRLLNPTLLLDPSRLGKGFGVGLGLRATAELSVVVGATIFKTMELDDGVSSAPGDAWTATGDLPTKEVFSRDGVGFALAVSVPVDVLAKLAE